MAKKQEELPIEGEGVSKPKIKAIDKAADKYVEVRDARMEMTEKEIAAKAVLLNAMHEAGLTEYQYGDMKVIVKPGKENVKVKNVDFDENDPDDDE